jgi:hypothetical protein
MPGGITTGPLLTLVENHVVRDGPETGVGDAGRPDPRLEAPVPRMSDTTGTPWL